MSRSIQQESLRANGLLSGPGGCGPLARGVG